MKKFILLGSLIIVIIVIAIGVSYSQKTSHNLSKDTPKTAVFDGATMTFIKTLNASDGPNLGDLYVAYGKDQQTFTSLVIANEVNGKQKVIYKINNTGFTNSIRKEMDISADNFYGFQFSHIGDDNFELHALYFGGTKTSDDVIVRWYPQNQVFGISPNSSSQMGSVLVHTLTTSTGAELAKIYADYNGVGTIATLRFMQKKDGTYTEVYEINAAGFYNTELGKQDLALNSGSFSGYQLVLAKDDYLILRPLYTGGQTVGSDMTVRWNYDQRSFLLEKTN